ncbi:MAG TPA: Flp pilus assembly protein CpaB [Dehalococcoidia bacterium]|nr:Flp pilus assembly protein CpaB [Dehalococcoidia bacterium]
MARVQQLTLAGQNKVLLLLALAAGAVAFVLVLVAINSGDDNNSSTPAVSADTRQILLTTQSIPAGTLITEEMLELREVPEDLILVGSYAETEAVVGEKAKITLAAGEQVTSAKVGLPVPEDGLAGVIPDGMRAVAIKVEEVTAVGGLLLPGDRIDVVAVTRIEAAPGLGENEYILRTEKILQNVEVLSVAQEAQKPAAGASQTEGEDTENGSTTSGQLPDDVNQEPDANTITVALSPVDALKVIQFQTYAVSVWAIERAFGDNAIIEIAPTEVVIVE